MGNGGINNRKSPCPLRAIKLQAIFFRRILIALSLPPFASPRLTLSHLRLTSSPSFPPPEPPRRNYLPRLHLARSPLRIRYIYTYISLFASVSALLHTWRSSPSSTLARSGCPSSSLSLSLFSSLFLAFFFPFFLRVVPFPPLATLSNRAAVLRRVEDLPLITLTPFHNSVPPPPDDDARFSLSVFFFTAFLPFLPGQPPLSSSSADRRHPRPAKVGQRNERDQLIGQG